MGTVHIEDLADLYGLVVDKSIAWEVFALTFVYASTFDLSFVDVFIFVYRVLCLSFLS